MSLYDSEESSHISREQPLRKKGTESHVFVSVIAIALIFGLAAGALIGGVAYWKLNKKIDMVRASLPIELRNTQEENIIKGVEQVSPAVVSIVLTKDQPRFERIVRDPFEDFFGWGNFQEPQQNGTEKIEVGQGSGFFVSADGLIITNKHVVLEDDVDYTVFTKEGDSYAATVLARDHVQDLAVLRVEAENVEFPFVELGDSNSLEIGQTVIAIGNVLGEFSNSVSAGIISGLGRTITASGDTGFVETIEDVIQTDAAINRGNSGGPLLNVSGQVIGVNTATVQGAQSIGFAIPVNIVKRDLKQVQEIGEIVYPLVGIEYQEVTKILQQEKNLGRDYGAFILSILKDSAAEKAELQKDDIVLEFDGQKITQNNSLGKIIQSYSGERVYGSGDEVPLKIFREGNEFVVTITLGRRE